MGRLKTSLVLTFLLLATINLILCSSQRKLSFKTVGIYSNCSSEGGHLPLASDTLAKETIQDYIKKTTVFKDAQFDYISQFIDCGNVRQLSETLVEILLDEKYHVPCGDQRKCNQSDIVSLFAHTENDFMLKLVSSILSLTWFPKICLPRSCDDEFQFSTFDDYSEYFLHVTRKLDWKHLTMLSFYEDHPTLSEEYLLQSYNLLMETKEYCLQRKSINVNNLTFAEDIFPHLQSWQKGESALILFGSYQTH